MGERLIEKHIFVHLTSARSKFDLLVYMMQKLYALARFSYLHVINCKIGYMCACSYRIELVSMSLSLSLSLYICIFLDIYIYNITGLLALRRLKREILFQFIRCSPVLSFLVIFVLF